MPLGRPAQIVRYTRHGVIFLNEVSELLRILGKEGWFVVRQRGSHRQLHHPTKPGTVTVAGKPSVDVPPGTLNSVLKQAGLKE